MLFTEYAKAVYAVLSADAALLAKMPSAAAIAERFGDDVGWPRLWLDDRSSEDWSDKTDDGVAISFDIHVGSRSDTTAEMRAIMNRVHTLLHDADLTLAAGVQSVLCRFERSVFINESDGKTRHGVMTFTLLISED